MRHAFSTTSRSGQSKSGRLSRPVLAAGVTLLMAASNPSAAVAAPVGKAAVPVLSGLCADGYLDSGSVAAARAPGGRIHGFASFRDSRDCGDRIYYFEGYGSTWRHEPTALTGKVVSAAADSTGVHLLAVTPGTGGAPGTAELGISFRNRAGQMSGLPYPLARVSAEQPFDGQGDIVAKDGRWFAVWSQYTGTPGDFHLYQATTMFGGDGEPGRFAAGWPPIMPTGTNPVLALRPEAEPGAGEQPQLYWQEGRPGGPRQIRHAPGAYGAWGAVTTVAPDVTVSPDFPGLDAAATAPAGFVTWTERTAAGDRVVVADDVTGSWRRSHPPAEDDLGSWDAAIAATGRTVHAAYGTGDGSPDGAFLGVKERHGPWSAGDITDGVPRSVDTFGVAGLIYDRAGRSTALVFSGHRLYAVSR